MYGGAEGARQGRPLTDSIEILYVHATIKVEGSTEDVERDGSGQRREGKLGTVYFSFYFSAFSRHNWV